MHLINTRTLKLETFQADDIPNYGILSHRWGKGEVHYKDMIEPSEQTNNLEGMRKIRGCCEQVHNNYYLDFVWVDTCCINSDSSAEPSESINSMYRWYQNASVCFAYLAERWPWKVKIRG